MELEGTRGKGNTCTGWHVATGQAEETLGSLKLLRKQQNRLSQEN